MKSYDQLIIALGYCIFMLIIFFVYFKYPPKKINYFYGYRTRRSMQNNETWSFANKYAAKLLINFSIYSLFIPPLLYFLYPEYNSIITIIVHTTLTLSVIYFTEIQLKRKFKEKKNQ
tara:strand:+ start:387 stop:737 length:351 start_codon:yes stop_codon:yes gene_type:complete